MSVSNELANIADVLIGYAKRQATIGPELAAILSNQILDLSRQAAQLERIRFNPAEQEAER